MVGCGYIISVVLYGLGCSNHTKRQPKTHVAVHVTDGGTVGSVITGQQIRRELRLDAGQWRGSSMVDIEWTPPPGAAELAFTRHRPVNPEGPPPYRFHAVLLGSGDRPEGFEVTYTAPGGVRAAVHDTFRVAHPETGETLHVSSFVNPYVGAPVRTSISGTRSDLPALDGAGSKLGSAGQRVWQSALWLYPKNPVPFEAEWCQGLIDAAGGGGFFVAVHYPQSSSGSSAVPIVLGDGQAPRLSVLDYTQPQAQQEILSMNLQLAPERLPWITDNLPITAGHGWTALQPNPATIPQCPAGFTIPAGMWELYAETVIDYSDDVTECSGCTLEHYVCFEDDSLVAAAVSFRGRLPIGLKSVQADGVSCVGPTAVRLHDWTDPPSPVAFTLSSGEAAMVSDPPGRVIFHHWLTNSFSSTAYDVNLQAESSLGLTWQFYSNAEATSPLSLPVSLPGNLNRQFWIAADIPAGTEGFETVRVTATAASAPQQPVWGTNFVQIGEWVAPPPPDSGSVWVPVASRAAGVGGSQWRTDLGLLNPGAEAAAGVLKLHLGGTTHQLPVTVAGGEQQILGDVVGLFGHDGSGALEVEGDQNLVVTSRTYSLLTAQDPCFPNGTFGQFLAGFTSRQGLSAGRSGWLPQLVENQSYRTNLAVTNTGSGPATVTVVLYDGLGEEITRFDLELAPGQWRQENRVFFRRGGRSDLGAAAAEVRVTSGSGVLAYASVVDNLTTDPTTIPLVAGGGAIRSWVPVASRAPGVGGSQWRTDLGLLNVSGVRATVRLRFHSQGAVSELEIPLTAGRQRLLTDVVGQVGANGSGALEVFSTQPIIVTSRTYNLLGPSDPCFPSGTFGQFLAGQAPTEGLAAGQTGLLPQLQENAAYRTNLALTNTGGANVTATVVLLDGAGDEISRFEVQLAPGEWKQENRVFFRRGGRSDLASASARVEVTAGGGVLAYASVVDNTTSDPTTMPLVR